MKHCAILSMANLEEFEVYDELLDKPFLDAGWQTHTVDWHDKSIDWNAYDVVLIRSPWDYQQYEQEFVEVLETIEASTAILENDLQTVRWNINKKYLQELEQQAVTIVPTLWKAQFDASELGGYFQHFKTEQIVIKPCVSANADNTFWLRKDNVEAAIAELQVAFAKGDFMVQPFMEHVISEGEFSCFYFNGQYSHSILKTPKQDDFRVQEEHGGRLALIAEPEAALLAHAEHALQCLPTMPMYARLDFVRHQDGFAMMEAELIEPSLYFNMDPTSPQRFVDCFVKRMG
ncbi:ATP-grasp domain-containing protein [Thalassotalea litorea]|uniref:ATP-grasp domain-containing protein n=1 Tax=Thalassotalea litorea TaxID=2020715 RepID=UPI003736CC52